MKIITNCGVNVINKMFTFTLFLNKIKACFWEKPQNGLFNDVESCNTKCLPPNETTAQVAYLCLGIPPLALS